MRHSGINRRLSALIALVLLFAQSGALAHSYEHDPGSPQGRVCSTCIAAHTLGAGCVDAAPHITLPAYKSPTAIERAVVNSSVRLPTARQRAPPTPL